MFPVAWIFPYYVKRGFKEIRRYPFEEYNPACRLTRSGIQMIVMQKIGKFDQNWFHFFLHVFRYQKSRPAGLVLEFEMWRHFDAKQKLLCLVALDCMVYPLPKFLISKTEKWPQFVSEVRGRVFFDHMLSCKAFATNSLNQTFVWDVWFHGQIVYINIAHLSNIHEINKTEASSNLRSLMLEGLSSTISAW